MPLSSNTMAMCCHLASFAGYFGNGIGCVVGPLIVWLIKKDEMPAVDEHGKEALNFNLSVLIYSLISVGLVILTFGLFLVIAIPFWIALAILHFVCTILAAIKANNGEFYRYPFTMRLI